MMMMLMVLAVVVVLLFSGDDDDDDYENDDDGDDNCVLFCVGMVAICQENLGHWTHAVPGSLYYLSLIWEFYGSFSIIVKLLINVEVIHDWSAKTNLMLPEWNGDDDDCDDEIK